MRPQNFCCAQISTFILVEHFTGRICDSKTNSYTGRLNYIRLQLRPHCCRSVISNCFVYTLDLANCTGHNMAVRCDPLLVSLIGHSFIRRLRDFMADNTDSTNHNLGLYCDQYEVSCVARGGLTVNKLCSCPQFTQFTRCPDIVFIQIGGNDLVCDTPNIPKLVRDIISYASYLKDGCGVRRVIIGQVLPRDPRRSTRTFNEDVVRLNLSLASACAELCNITFWKHRGFWATMDFLAADGVHIRSDLDGYYLRKYRQSIKSAILHVSKSL